MNYTQTPTPSVTNTPSLTPSNTPSYTPTGTVCPGLTPTSTGTPNPTPSITQTNTPSLTPSVTTSPTNTPTVSLTPSITPSPEVECFCYFILNETGGSLNYTYWNCQAGETTNPLGGGQNIQVCSSQYPIGDPGITIVPCVSVTNCNFNSDCTGCAF